jgi:hypothetical protein
MSAFIETSVLKCYNPLMNMPPDNYLITGGIKMFETIVARYRTRLEQMQREGAKPSDIAYVQKCIGNFEEQIERLKKMT